MSVMLEWPAEREGREPGILVHTWSAATHIFPVLQWSVVQLVLCVCARDVPQGVYAASLKRCALETLACFVGVGRISREIGVKNWPLEKKLLGTILNQYQVFMSYF